MQLCKSNILSLHFQKNTGFCGLKYFFAFTIRANLPPSPYKTPRYLFRKTQQPNTMKPIFTALFFCLLLSAQALAQKKIVILGSSTAAGNGASTYDSSWARRLYFEFNKNTSDGVDTTI